MSASVEATTSLERKLTVTVPAAELNSAVNEKLKQTSRKIRLDGFRPGKVPVAVVKQRYGAGIRAEALEEAVRKHYIQALTDEQLSPVGDPKIEFTKNDVDADVEFVATFEVMPEIEVAPFTDMEFVRESAEVTDADISTMIESLRSQRADYESVERPAQSGDQVTIDFLGKIDGEAFAGGAANDHQLILGSGQMIPGFEAGIEGMSSGESKIVDVNFPDDYGKEELAGKAAQFEISLKAAAAPQLPALDKDFFAQFSAKSDNLDDFKQEVRANMEREASTSLANRLKTAVLDKLVSANEFEVPAALVGEEVHRLKHQAAEQFAGDQKIDPHALPDEMFSEQALRRVKIGLLINQIIQQAALKADETKVMEHIEQQAAVYQDPQQVVDYYKGNAELMNQARAMVVENQAIDHILEQSQVSEAKLSYEQATKTS